MIRMIKFSGKHQDWEEDVVPKESEYEAAEAE